MKKFFLVDVSSLFFRAFFAIRHLSSPEGMPTNAIYGFLSMILKLFREQQPEYLVFCLDRKEPSFRKEIYSEYKANRSEMPEDLVPQLPYIQRIAGALGIPSIDLLGFEADDIIGTLTKKCLSAGHEVVIVSGDKDFAQLVGAKVRMLDTMKGVFVDETGVIEKWLVRPEQMIDFLSMTGDTSDNVPGIEGVGPKTAAKLLNQFNTLEGVIAAAEKGESENFSEKLREKILSSKNKIEISKKLVTIHQDAPLIQSLEDLHLRPFNRNSLDALLKELNFRNLDKAIEQAFPAATDESFGAVNIQGASNSHLAVQTGLSTQGSWKLIERGALKPGDFCQTFPQAAIVQVIEAPNGVYLAKKIDDRSVEFWKMEGDPIEWSHVFSGSPRSWSGFNLKKFFRQWGVREPKVIWDHQLAAYVVKAGENMSWEHIFTRFTGSLVPDLPSPAQTVEMHQNLEHSLRKIVEEIGAGAILQELDFPLINILAKMETKGIRLDRDILHLLSETLTSEIRALEKKIFSLSGDEFNIASPKQLAFVLFEKLKLPVGKKTKTGYSTDSDVLEKLQEKHPIIKELLEFRELTKLKSTYVDALPKLVGEDGRLHSTFNQALTTTGRLSSQDPNLQNIPIRSERGQKIRRAFVADAGKFLLSVDYSQIELRVLAHVSEDKNLIRAFLDDLDIHAATAAEVFQVPLAEVTSAQRRTAKAVNFGIAYGQGAFGLAENLGIPRKDAQDIISKYFTKFPGVQDYIEHTIHLAREKGYVQTLVGRRRYIDELRDQNPVIRKAGERAAINAPIQGTASDIVKKAMIKISETTDLARIDLILQVHDELIFEATKWELEQSRQKIVSLMENVLALRVPLKANAALGQNWDEAHG
jgi:DNA polymerase-1